MNPAKVPKKLLVGNRYYEVSRIKGLTEKTGYFGLCDPKKRTISLDASLKGEMLERTLAHEVIHAFDFEYGFNQIFERQALELHAENLSNFLTSLFRLSFR